MIIESHEEHRLALLQLGFYTDFGYAPHDQAWLEVLSEAIEAYELTHFPISDPTPEEAAAFRAAEGGPICKEKGHVPVEKMSATICDRCGAVLVER